MDRTAAQTVLDSLVGEWAGTNRTWFEPEVLADESPIRGTVRSLPGCPSVVYEYETALQGQQVRGIAIVAFNTFSSQFEAAWVDNFHMATNMMVSRGGGRAGGFSVLGSYQDPSGGPAWGWRTDVDISDGSRLTVTAWNVTPSGDEARAVEARFTRVP